MPSDPCTDCGKEKPDDEFKWCPRCRSRRSEAVRRWRKRHPELSAQRHRDYQRRMREKDPNYTRRRAAKQKYGLTLEEYEAYLAEPCAICGATDVKMVLDHDHHSGTVRSGLCEPCNQAIGFMRDNPERLRAAADYLERHALPIYVLGR